MRKVIPFRIRSSELKIIISFYEAQGIIDSEDERRLKELRRIYNRDVKKSNKIISLFEEVG